MVLASSAHWFGCKLFSLEHSGRAVQTESLSIHQVGIILSSSWNKHTFSGTGTKSYFNEMNNETFNIYF